MKMIFLNLLLFIFPLSLFANIPYTPIEFPRDDGGHIENVSYKYDQLTEWWYYNGIVESAKGNRFGYMVSAFTYTKKFKLFQPKVPFVHIQLSDLTNKTTYGCRKRFSWSNVSISTKKLDINYGDELIAKRMPMANIFC